MKRLTEENEKLKEQIMELSKHLNQERPQSLTSQTSYNTYNNSVAVQANENKSGGDISEMETELLKYAIQFNSYGLMVLLDLRLKSHQLIGLIRMSTSDV